MKQSVESLLLVFSLVAVATTTGVKAQPKTMPPIEWPTFNQALDAASKSGKIILIDIFSPTCGWCKKLQTTVYTQSDLQTYVRDTFELGQLDITVDDDAVTYKGYELSSAQLGAGFGATGTPTTIFLSPDGEYITRLPGFHEHDDFFEVMRYIGSESFREMSFIEFQAKESPGESSDRKG